MAKPGVGYVVPFPQHSYAGASHSSYNPKWSSPVRLNTSVNIEGLAGFALDQALANRYAGGDVNRRRAGAPGLHSSDIRQYLKEAFATKTAWWKVNYEEWDGNPTITEVLDLHFCQKGERGLARWIESRVKKQQRQSETDKIDTNNSTSTPTPTPTPISTTPPPIPTPIAIIPLSPPQVRVEELRHLILSNSSLPSPWDGHVRTLLHPIVWTHLKNIAVDLLTLLRKLRKSFGLDSRSIPE